jgi:hypothetical protein
MRVIQEQVRKTDWAPYKSKCARQIGQMWNITDECVSYFGTNILMCMYYAGLCYEYFRVFYCLTKVNIKLECPHEEREKDVDPEIRHISIVLLSYKTTFNIEHVLTKPSPRKHNQRIRTRTTNNGS